MNNQNITLIAAVSSNNIIGIDGKLPWNIPSDLKRFKQLTLGKTIIMGRKTFESIGRPLPGRKNIILSSQMNNPLAVKNVNDALQQSVGEIMIIGGESIYNAFLPLANKMYITHVNYEVPYGIYTNPTHFIEIDSTWKEVSREYFNILGDDFSYYFVEYEKITL